MFGHKQSVDRAIRQTKMHWQFPTADHSARCIEQAFFIVCPKPPGKSRMGESSEILFHRFDINRVAPKVDCSAFYRRAFAYHQRTVCIGCKKRFGRSGRQEIRCTAVAAIVLTFFCTLDLFVDTVQQFIDRLIANLDLSGFACTMCLGGSILMLPAFSLHFIMTFRMHLGKTFTQPDSKRFTNALCITP